MNQTTFWSARVAFHAANSSNDDTVSSGFWNDPNGNPHPPDENSEYTSPFKAKRVLPRDSVAVLASRQDSSPLNPSPDGILQYTGPIQYKVRKTGYYCVGECVRPLVLCSFSFRLDIAMVPVTVLTTSTPTRQTSTDVPFHPKYSGKVLFQNTFNGKLPAADYPKVNVSSNPLLYAAARSD